MLENVKLPVAYLMKNTRTKASFGDGKEPREQPPEDWEVKRRRDIPTLEIKGDSLTDVNRVSSTYRSGQMYSCNTGGPEEVVAAVVKNLVHLVDETWALAKHIFREHD